MSVAAILALLGALGPLIPSLAAQIQAIIGEITHHGELTPLAISQIHELAKAIHQQVGEAEDARLATTTAKSSKTAPKA